MKRRLSAVFATLAVGITLLAAPASAQIRSADDWHLNPAGVFQTEYDCVVAGQTGYLGGAWKDFRCEYVGLGWRMWVLT
ncbi:MULTISPECIES: hypothetical protein [unclassified Streptomyces]|uniref:hypothetical protein n=1 Tax=Streptomyces sp. NPDC021093 TaxID=3365112 RepID=UPI0037A3A6BD